MQKRKQPRPLINTRAMAVFGFIKCQRWDFTSNSLIIQQKIPVNSLKSPPQFCRIPATERHIFRSCSPYFRQHPAFHPHSYLTVSPESIILIYHRHFMPLIRFYAKKV